jgi:hypothetical protein
MKWDASENHKQRSGKHKTVQQQREFTALLNITFFGFFFHLSGPNC